MSRAGSLRLFVALEVPLQARERLVAWAREALGDALSQAGRRPRAMPRVLSPESLHLTLCFLGSRPAAEVPALAAALATSPAGEPEGAVGELAVGAPLWLPRRRPNVLAVEVRDEDGRLEALQASVCCRLAAAGEWQPERRGFRAHITVARLRGGQPQPLPPTPRLSFRPEAIVLYRSHLDPAGARYDALAMQALAAA